MVNVKRTDLHGQVRQITGHNGLPFSRERVEIRELASPDKLAELLNATRGNNLDEIIFKTTDGKHYVVFADELTSGTKRGDTIEVGDLKGEVVAVDDECNEDRWAVAGGVLLATGIVATGIFVASGGAATLFTVATGASEAALGVGAGELALGTAALSAPTTFVARGVGNLVDAMAEDPATLKGLTVPVKKK